MRRRYLIIAIFGIVAGVAVWAFATRPGRFFATGGAALGSSLSRSAGGAGGGCTQQEGRSWWWCGVELDAGSGVGRSYVLSVTGNGCWRARPARVVVLREEAGSPHPSLVKVELHSDRPSEEGCVDLLDMIVPDSGTVGSDDRQLELQPVNRSE
jgi:hypothetical protein